MQLLSEQRPRAAKVHCGVPRGGPLADVQLLPSWTEAWATHGIFKAPVLFCKVVCDTFFFTTADQCTDYGSSNSGACECA